MNKLSNKFGLLIALLFAISCVKAPDNYSTAIKASDITKKIAASVTNVKIDTLCVYRIDWGLKENYASFKTEDELISFLKTTGYYENDTLNRWFKKIAHQPDFKKWTYFAYAGYPDYIDIYEGKDTINVTFTHDHSHGRKAIPEYMNMVVCFIPFTEKTIEFTNVIKRYVYTLHTYKPHKLGKESYFLFQNDVELASFLISTGCHKSDTICRTNFTKIAFETNFKKWTYFAFAGNKNLHNVVTSEGKDTVTIIFTHLLPNRSESLKELPEEIVYTYFIPFTEKPIKLAKIIKQREK